MQFIKGKTGKLDFIKTKKCIFLQNTLFRILKNKVQTGKKYLLTTYLTREQYLEYRTLIVKPKGRGEVGMVNGSKN